jgi:hypothetical protein
LNTAITIFSLLLCRTRNMQSCRQVVEVE